MSNNYGVVRTVKNMVADDIVADLMNSNRSESMSYLLHMGHRRDKLIDDYMMNRMGENVRDWWTNLSVVWRSQVRRSVWEKILIRIRAHERAGTKASKLKRPAKQLTSLESLLDSVNESPKGVSRAG